MRGTMLAVNKAMQRPLLMAGVEKRLALANALVSFPLVAATHFHLPACLIGVVFFVVMHFMFVMISKRDAHLGKLIQRSTRYCVRSYFPAKSHPLMTDIWTIKTISRPK